MGVKIREQEHFCEIFVKYCEIFLKETLLRDWEYRGGYGIIFIIPFNESLKMRNGPLLTGTAGKNRTAAGTMLQHTAAAKPGG